MRGRFGIGVARLVPSPGTTWIAALLASVFLSAPPSADARRADDGGAPALVIPLLTPADDVRQGFARIINHSARAGTVRIYGTDDGGRVHGPLTLSVNAGAAREFSSRDLEAGNASKGLSGHLGDGEGSWRLRLESDLDLEAGAYIRTPDGFVASVHDVARTAVVGGETVHRVPLFNPGSSRDPASWLRVVNLTDAMVEVTIEGRDDEGEPAPGGEVRLTLPAGGARHLSAQQLESGGAGLTGRLGDGEGRWQLSVTADGIIEVMGLMQTTAGHLTNVSRSGLRDVGTPGTESAPPAGSTFRDCAACPEMVVIPIGSFRMGAEHPFAQRDERPAHGVFLGHPFAVGVYEVTFAEWDACHRAGGCSHNPDDQGWGRGNRPVVDVSWNDAQEYVRWLSEETGRSYRLPSEAEWEYAARAGTTTQYWWGNSFGDNRANCDRCGSAWDDRQTAPVGSFSPNSFGLHDVHGNVWERVQDCRNEYNYVGAPRDGSAWESGNCDARVVRGGGWRSTPLSMRAANRGWVTPPGSRAFDAETGFRVALTLPPPIPHTLALFRAAGQTPQGVARIINRSDREGMVFIYGTDDVGRKRGPVFLYLDPGATVHFDSDDLERSNPLKGFIVRDQVRDGTGDWRLELITNLDIEPSAYVRTPDGLLAPMHAVARTVEVGGDTVHQVPIFNSGSNRHEVSWLRVANLGDEAVLVTIRGRDDAGEEPEDAARPTEIDEVRLMLPGGAARRLSAQQLESGDHPDLSGRLGEGTGKWRLFVTAEGEVTAGGAIEVMSLAQSPTGHLSNVSTAVRRGFEVVSGGPATVRPLETIHLTVPGGLGDSDYTVLMDLSGTGEFPEDETLEVEGLTTDDDQILFASPLTQILPEANASHRLAVRVRREADQATSNILRYSIEDITSIAGPPGFATMIFEAVQKSIYASADDPLLNLKAASIRPGLVAFSAARLGADLTFSDVLAEATMQSLLGMPVTELAPVAPAPAASPGPYSASQVRIAPANAGSGEDAQSPLLRICNSLEDFLTSERKICNGVKNLFRTANSFQPKDCLGSDGQYDQKCLEENKNGRYKAQVETTKGAGNVMADVIKEGTKAGANILTTGLLRQWEVGEAGIKAVTEGVVKPGIDELMDSRSVKNSAEVGVEVGRVRKTPDDEGTKKEYDEEAVKLFRAFLLYHLEKKIKELAPKVDKDIAAGPNLDGGAKEAYSVVMNDVDRRLKEIETHDDQEAVRRGEKKLSEAVGNDPNRGMAAASKCEPGYREFPHDEDGRTSTCVYEPLVEENCYKGSRQPSDVNLGNSEACMYYSLDYLQPGDRCRANYKRVYSPRGWTCRWADLGPDQPAWYTLHKALDDEGEDDERKDNNVRELSGPEWIRAQNVDCHIHVSTLDGIDYSTYGRSVDTERWRSYSYLGACRERKTHGDGNAALSDSENPGVEARYVGDWREGRASGQGILTISQHGMVVLVLEGTFVDGRLHGQGTLEHVPADQRFEGEFRHGEEHGYGVQTYPRGTGACRFEGQYRDGFSHGRGTLACSDGTHGDGEWRFGQLWTGTQTDERGCFARFSSGALVDSRNCGDLYP